MQLRRNMPGTTDPAVRRSLGDREALPVQLARDLRARLASKEWQPDERIPTESELVETYRVSRATVRQALKTLEGQGLIVTVRGRGSFVAGGAMIRAGMQELTSITSTIAEMGHTPAMIYHHRVLRPATEAESGMFGVPAGSEVLDIQRRILADGTVVAYSYDVLPRWVFPADFVPSELTGSVFAFLAQTQGPVPARAAAHVHAVDSPDVVWGDDDLGDHPLFVLLDQLHYDTANRPFMHTRSYFVEGRFNFTVLRTSPEC
jgi:GntR family transcriptional regulator